MGTPFGASRLRQVLAVRVGMPSGASRLRQALAVRMGLTALLGLAVASARAAGMRLLQLDAAAARWANVAAHRHAAAHRVVGAAAAGLAAAEIVLMLLLGLSGRPRASARMLLAVSTVYAAVELIGAVWRRERPFANLEQIAPVVPHTAERSFPSRHVASAVAMARVASRARPALGRLMAILAGLLALGRVAAGLHYPSDALAGAALGFLVGGLFRDWP
jgi:undecaprenyl-diphosphatase